MSGIIKQGVVDIGTGGPFEYLVVADSTDWPEAWPERLIVRAVFGRSRGLAHDYVPERTCQNIDKYGGFECSECGADLTLDDDGWTLWDEAGKRRAVVLPLLRREGGGGMSYEAGIKCPFCGKPMTLSAHQWDRTFDARVLCRNCGVSGPTVLSHSMPSAEHGARAAFMLLFGRDRRKETE